MKKLIFKLLFWIFIILFIIFSIILGLGYLKYKNAVNNISLIDKVQETFNLTNEDCMPSRAGLCRFGNTSSPSIWYELTFLERTEVLQKHDRILQMAFGSGIKANTLVWRKIN